MEKERKDFYAKIVYLVRIQKNKYGMTDSIAEYLNCYFLVYKNFYPRGFGVLGFWG